MTRYCTGLAGRCVRSKTQPKKTRTCPLPELPAIIPGIQAKVRVAQTRWQKWSCVR
jgi:hypothetical protein